MILQALTAHYETLTEQGVIDRPGWTACKISYALYINEQGELEQVVCLKQEELRGKKSVLLPRVLSLPAPQKRTVGIAANFLWDNTSYILGVDNKGKPQRSLDCFADCRRLHQEILTGVHSPAAQAILAFFEHWEPAQAASHPALRTDWEDILSGANLTFRYHGAFVHEDPLIRQAWQRHYDGGTDDTDGTEMICLVTGKREIPSAIHPTIKGVAGAQSSGAALVSFNAPAFCSYGHTQNLNAPVGQYAAFAYTAALNHLLADHTASFRTGDTTVLFWAKDGQPAYQDFFSRFVQGDSTGDLLQKTKALFQGDSVLYEDTKLDSGMNFCILGLAPNAARLSVRFFLHNTFGCFLENVQRHYERLDIVRPATVPFETLPLWQLLQETVNQQARDKSPVPGMAGDILRAILTDTPYPATLLNGVILRIRAERNITWGRAAILKAYYLKTPHPSIPDTKEVFTVSLNPDSKSVPYNLGRLFSLLEAVQSAANPGINTTIKDKYFNSASATPSRVFPLLTSLTQKHLRKLDQGKQIYYQKQLSEILGRFGEQYPDRLSLPEQGAFQLGYYHQTQVRYQKKEEKENG